MSQPPPLPDEPPRRQTALIVLLVFLCAGLVALIVWRNLPEEVHESDSTAAHFERGTPAAPRLQLDVDKLVAGYLANQDYFRQLEAETLAEYDRLNPSDKPWYDEGRRAAQLYAVFVVWNDFYGQGVLQAADDLAGAAYKKGSRDPLISNICDTYTFQDRYSNNNQSMQEHIRRVRDLDASRYPALFKFVATTFALKSLAVAKENPKSLRDDLSPSWAEVPKLVSTIGGQFTALLNDKVPPAVLFYRTGDLYDRVQDDQCLVPVGNEVEKAFAAVAPDHPARAALRGDFLQTWAWQARGSGWASTVTEDGARKMGERLEEARLLLTDAYQKNPQDYLSATVMLGVELGLGNGRPVMERWFERAMRNHPENFKACSGKMWYLQPRWYGTPEDVVEFGQECVRSGNWQAKIPMMLPIGIGHMADLQKDLYRHDVVWNLVAPVYEEYLKRYPDSIVVRTTYADCAARGNHLDVLRTQLAALGPNWDRTKWSDQDYRRISQLARQN